MLTCTGCGASGTGAFCGHCGRPMGAASSSPSGPPAQDFTPVARAGGAKIVGYLLLGVLAIGVGGGGYVLATRGSDGDSPAPGTAADSSVAADTASTAPGSATTSDGTSEAPTPSDTTSSAATTPTRSAQARALDDLRSARQASLAGLVLDGRWVLQLSSKSNGISDERQTALDGGHVFHYDDILAEHAQTIRGRLEPRGWSSLTLLASDFGNYHAGNDRFWVLLADPGGIGSPSEAEVLCAELYPGKTGKALDDVCLPRRLRP